MKKLLLITMVIVLAACSTEPRSSKPSASGRAGELLVVMPTNQWKGHAGEIVRGVFQTNVPMLMQAEPTFDVVQVNETAFVKMFETHRHIFMVDIDPSLEKATVEMNQHLWSYPQMVIRVKAPNDSLLERVMNVNEESFREYYLKIETQRLINAYKRMVNEEARQAVQEMFGFTMIVPEGYYVAKRGEDFMWLRRTSTNQDLDMGVLIATMPYNDPATDFDPQTIRQRRDSLTREYIPGQMPDSYMTTYEELDHAYREISFNGHYAMEARGLWRMEGDFMGGPFVNYTLVDQKNNRLVILDGFIYAPDFDKRDYMRQVEAVIRSLSLEGDDPQETEEEAVPPVS
ncbi:MAG: DUF4837 family protein [Bacteroidales bacterium]